jgi:hypothetical protein
MHRLKGKAPLAVACVALFVALGGGYAIGAGFVGTGDLKNQAVTNKKIKKGTIRANRIAPDTLTGAQINEGSLKINTANPSPSAAATAQVAREDPARQVPAGSTTAVPVLTLQVPAGSYVINSKAVLAKGGTQDPVQCFLTAQGDQDRSLEAVDAANNTTISNLLVHTFATSGAAVTLACDNPGGATLLVTNRVITATPVAGITPASNR